MTRYNRHRSASERPERPDGKRYQSKRTSSVTKSVQTGPRFVSDRTDEELEAIIKKFDPEKFNREVKDQMKRDEIYAQAEAGIKENIAEQEKAKKKKEQAKPRPTWEGLTWEEMTPEQRLDLERMKAQAAQQSYAKDKEKFNQEKDKRDKARQVKTDASMNTYLSGAQSSVQNAVNSRQFASANRQRAQGVQHQLSRLGRMIDDNTGGRMSDTASRREAIGRTGAAIGTGAELLSGFLGAGGNLIGGLMSPDMFGNNVSQTMNQAASNMGDLSSAALGTADQMTTGGAINNIRDEMIKGQKDILAKFNVSSPDQLKPEQLPQYQSELNRLYQIFGSKYYGKFGNTPIWQSIDQSFGALNQEAAGLSKDNETRADIAHRQLNVDGRRLEGEVAQAQGAIDAATAKVRDNIAATAFSQPDFADGTVLDAMYKKNFGDDYKTNPARFREAADYYMNDLTLRQTTDMIASISDNSVLLNNMIDMDMKSKGLDPNAVENMAERANLAEQYMAKQLVPGSDLYDAISQTMSDDDKEKMWKEARDRLYGTNYWTPQSQLEDDYLRFMTYRQNKNYYLRSEENQRFLENFAEERCFSEYGSNTSAALADYMLNNPNSKFYQRLFDKGIYNVMDQNGNEVLVNGKPVMSMQAVYNCFSDDRMDTASIKKIISSANDDLNNIMDEIYASTNNQYDIRNYLADFGFAGNADIGQILAPSAIADDMRAKNVDEDLIEKFMKHNVLAYGLNMVQDAIEMKASIRDVPMYIDRVAMDGVDKEFVQIRQEIMRNPHVLSQMYDLIDNNTKQSLAALDRLMVAQQQPGQADTADNDYEALMHFNGYAAYMPDNPDEPTSVSAYGPMYNALIDLYDPILKLYQDDDTGFNHGGLLRIAQHERLYGAPFSGAVQAEKELSPHSANIWMALQSQHNRLNEVLERAGGGDLEALGSKAYHLDPNSPTYQSDLQDVQHRYKVTSEYLINNEDRLIQQYGYENYRRMLGTAIRGRTYTSMRTFLGHDPNRSVIDLGAYTMGGYNLRTLIENSAGGRDAAYDMIFSTLNPPNTPVPLQWFQSMPDAQKDTVLAYMFSQAYNRIDMLATRINPYTTPYMDDRRQGILMQNNPFYRELSTDFNNSQETQNAFLNQQDTAEAVRGRLNNPTRGEIQNILNMVFQANDYFTANPPSP